YYVLAGAVLTDFGMGGNVRTGPGVSGASTVEAEPDSPPGDRLLRPTWQYVAGKPRGVQTVLAAMGPALREPLLERLIERGDIRRVKRKMLGMFTTSALESGGGRRDALLADVRAVLVDGAE